MRPSNAHTAHTAHTARTAATNRAARRGARRGQRGAVFVEALAVIVMLTTMLGGIILMQGYAGLRLRTQNAARAVAMTNAQGGCGGLGGGTQVTANEIFTKKGKDGKSSDLAGDIAVAVNAPASLSDALMTNRLTGSKTSGYHGKPGHTYQAGPGTEDANAVYSDFQQSNGWLVPSSMSTVATGAIAGTGVNTKSTSYILCNDPKIREGNIKSMVKQVMEGFMSSIFSKLQ